MNVSVAKRQSGHIPLGAFLMLPLFALPLGGWFVQQKWVDLGTCAMKLAVGLPCLSCGATRGTIRLLYGDLVGAAGFQPMIMSTYAVLLVWGLVSLGLFAVDKRAHIVLTRREDRLFKGALIVLPLVNWGYLIAAGI